MLAQALSATVETLLNKALALNIHDNNELNKLNGQSLTLILAELSFALTFTVCGKSILVTSIAERADCEINTSIRNLLRLKREQALTQLIKEGLLDIQGDLKVAQQFAAIADKLEIDWQTALARYIGDIATHKLIEAGNNLRGKLSRLSPTGVLYLTSLPKCEEIKFLITRPSIASPATKIPESPNTFSFLNIPFAVFKRVKSEVPPPKSQIRTFFPLSSELLFRPAAIGSAQNSTRSKPSISKA